MRRAAIGLLMVVVPALLPALAEAAYPGENGRIAYVHTGQIWTTTADGAAPRRLTSPVSPQSDSAPSWSPDGTRIAFTRSRGVGFATDIWVVNDDGTGEALLEPEGHGPTWSPDGQELAFVQGDFLMRVDSDGSNRRVQFDVNDTADGCCMTDAAWSPGGERIAFGYDGFEEFCEDPPFECGLTEVSRIGASLVPGPGQEVLAKGLAPDWSPAGNEIAFETPAFGGGSSGNIAVVDRASGTIRTIASGPEADRTPAWSPDGTRVVFARTSGAAPGLWAVNGDGTGLVRVLDHGTQPNWQPGQRRHVRPRSAGVVKVSLVPAFRPCAEPNRAHGPPLAHPSCAPPVPGSPRLMVGIGDGHPATARSTGFVRLNVLVGAPGGIDDTDVGVRLRLTNVMHTANLSEYTREIGGSIAVRLTDEDGATSETTQDFGLAFTAPCVATASSTEKATCETATSLDALVPGSAPDHTRAIWALDQVQVYDGGPDEDADTKSDNSLLAVQGVFVP